MASIVNSVGNKEINVSYPVGEGGMNKRDDVMVIQAMLKYGLEKLDYFRNDVFGMPTGVMLGDSLGLIRKYQRYLRRERDLKISVDGRIDSSKGIWVTDRKRLIWTIGQLNSETMVRHMFFNAGGGKDHVEGIRNLYPQVDAILAGTAVGSLNLGLA